MSLVRRRLFWKIYLTLLASLIAAILFMGAFFWFIGETQRETMPRRPGAHHRYGPREVSHYDADGKMIAAGGKPLTMADFDARHRWGPYHVMRVDLPDGGFVLTSFGPPVRARAFRLLIVMLTVAAASASPPIPSRRC